MTLRAARLILGSLPAGTVGFGDAIDGAPATIPANETSLLSELRQRLLSDEALAENLQSGDADALTVLFDGIPRFHFAEFVEFAKADQPRLLAECDHRTFAPWSLQDSLAPGNAEAQVLRRDFDPNAYTTPLNPGFKKNLPAFQFTPNALQ